METENRGNSDESLFDTLVGRLLTVESDRTVREEAASYAVMKLLLRTRNEPPVEDPLAYAFAVANNRIKKQRKQRAREDTLKQTLRSIGPTAATSQAEAASIRRELYAAMLSELTPRQRYILWSKLVADKPYRDIAAELNLSHTAVRNDYLNALDRIRQRLS